MFKKLFPSAALVVSVALSGCSSNHHHDDSHHHDHHWSHQEQSQPAVQTVDKLRNWQVPASVYSPRVTHKLLSDYTEVMAMKLIENMKYVTPSAKVAVTSFVELDNNLQTTSVLGNQLAESFMQEMQAFGLSVIDFKSMGKVMVTANGDFTFSRDKSVLAHTPDLDYVLSGTMTYNNRGVIINARIIGVESKVVVSSAKGFIPHFIVESLYPNRLTDGIDLSAN